MAFGSIDLFKFDWSSLRDDRISLLVLNPASVSPNYHYRGKRTLRDPDAKCTLITCIAKPKPFQNVHPLLQMSRLTALNIDMYISTTNDSSFHQKSKRMAKVQYSLSYKYKLTYDGCVWFAYEVTVSNINWLHSECGLSTRVCMYYNTHYSSVFINANVRFWITTMWPNEWHLIQRPSFIGRSDYG